MNSTATQYKDQANQVRESKLHQTEDLQETQQPCDEKENHMEIMLSSLHETHVEQMNQIRQSTRSQART